VNATTETNGTFGSVENLCLCDGDVAAAVLQGLSTDDWTMCTSCRYHR
jgi:hypothetical protein